MPSAKSQIRWCRRRRVPLPAPAQGRWRCYPSRARPARPGKMRSRTNGKAWWETNSWRDWSYAGLEIELERKRFCRRGDQLALGLKRTDGFFERHAARRGIRAEDRLIERLGDASRASKGGFDL